MQTGDGGPGGVRTPEDENAVGNAAVRHAASHRGACGLPRGLTVELMLSPPRSSTGTRWRVTQAETLCVGFSIRRAAGAGVER